MIMRGEIEQLDKKLVERCHVLKGLIEDRERKEKQAQDFEQDTKDLKRWFDESRKFSLPSGNAEIKTSEVDERASEVRKM